MNVGQWFVHYVSPEYESAQCEIAGLSLRVGNRAFVFGRFDYREKTSPWPMWARVRIVLRHHPYPDFPPRWSLYALGRTWFDIGGRP